MPVGSDYGCVSVLLIDQLMTTRETYFVAVGFLLSPPLLSTCHVHYYIGTFKLVGALNSKVRTRLSVTLFINLFIDLGVV